MNGDIAIHLAMQAMLARLRAGAAVPGRRPDRRPGRLDLPGGDVDPGDDAVVHPEDRRDRHRARDRGPVDARPHHRRTRTQLFTAAFPARRAREQRCRSSSRRSPATSSSRYVLVLTASAGCSCWRRSSRRGRCRPRRRSIDRRRRSAFALTPLASKGQAIPADAPGMVLLIVKEVIVGLAFAFALSAIVAAVQLAAALIDTMSASRTRASSTRSRASRAASSASSTPSSSPSCSS